MIEQSAPKLKAPRNSCDCHIHVYDPAFPTAATAKVLPPPGKPQMFRQPDQVERLDDWLDEVVRLS